MIPKLSDCQSPIRPTHYNVVLAIDTIGEKTAGGIIMPDKLKDREDAASEKGLIVAVSPMAFKGADWDMESSPPRVGDTVLFQRHSGREIDVDSTDIKYRVIADDDIKGIYND